MNKKENSQSTTQRCPHDKKHPYTIINNDIIVDTNISATARILLIYMLSRPEGWIFYHNQLGAALGFGETAIRSAFEDLINAGYAYRERRKSSKGHFVPYDYFITEIPNSKEIIRDKLKKCLPNVISQPGSTGLDNRALVNNENNDIDLNKYLKDVNEKVPKKPPDKSFDSSFKNIKTSSLNSSETLSPDRVKILHEYRFKNGQCIKPKTLMRWLVNHTIQEIFDSIKYYEEQNKREAILRPEAYVEKALREGWGNLNEIRKWSKSNEARNKRSRL